MHDQYEYNIQKQCYKFNKKAIKSITNLKNKLRNDTYKPRLIIQKGMK